MKKRKKILALLLSTAMVLTMGMTAFATETGDASAGGTSQTTVTTGNDGVATGSATSGQTTEKTCTITAPKTQHQYEVYQIFTCRYETAADGTTKMTDIKWGTNGTDTTGAAVSESILEELEKASGSDENKLAVITKYVSLSNPVATITNGGNYTGPEGYYLIKDKDGTIPTGDTGTKFVVKAAGVVTIAPKSSTTPGFEKKIKDRNDSTNAVGTYTDWQDSADYDIGDSIPFKLQGTVATDYGSYSKYYFAFHDVEEKGLAFDGAETVKVYIDGTELADKSKYEVKTSGCSDGCSFEVIFNNLKDISSVHAGSKICVEYTSKLTEQANLGNQGNINKAKLEYSNNPSGDQHGETTWDQVIAFTYKVVINKVDKDNKPLAGAKFKLEKKLQDGNWKEISVVETAANTTVFTFKGLDDGHYKLTETEAPKYYNSIDPVEFDVTAAHVTTSDIADRTTVLTSLSGTKTTGAVELTFTSNTGEGSLTTNVINKSGTTLPETGGIGTTIFYIIGGVLVAGAAVALITRKRMKSSEK